MRSALFLLLAPLALGQTPYTDRAAFRLGAGAVTLETFDSQAATGCVPYLSCAVNVVHELGTAAGRVELEVNRATSTGHVHACPPTDPYVIELPPLASVGSLGLELSVSSGWVADFRNQSGACFAVQVTSSFVGVVWPGVISANLYPDPGAPPCSTLDVLLGDPGPLCGDCNGDGAVDALDVLAAAQAALRTIPAPSCCDVDSSGGVTILDALLIARAAAGFPARLLCP